MFKEYSLLLRSRYAFRTAVKIKKKGDNTSCVAAQYLFKNLPVIVYCFNTRIAGNIPLSVFKER
jgi:hypothetical protein